MLKKMILLMMTNFEIRVEFTDNLQRMNDGPIMVFIKKRHSKLL